MIDPRYVESAAYHEAGHAVVAAVQAMPLREKGVHCDSLGSGITFYWYRLPDGSKDVGSEVERERTVITTCAGLIAQEKFYPGCPTCGAADDYALMVKLLNEMYSDHNLWLPARDKLYGESKALVEQHWSAIVTLGLALWAKPWVPRIPDNERNWSQATHEKWMNGNEAVSILRQCGLPAILVADSAGKYDLPG